MASVEDAPYTAEATERNLPEMNGQQTYVGITCSEHPQAPSSDIIPRNSPPALTIPTSSTLTSSSSFPKHQLSPDTGPSPRFRPKSPQLRQQLILRTSSPNFQPRAFKTYCHSPRRCGTPVSNTSSELKGSTHSAMYISTIRPADISSGTMNLPSGSFGRPTDNGVSTAQTTEGNFAYSNPGFDTNEEIVLNPLSLWPHRGDDGTNGEDEAFVEEMVVIERPIYTQKDFDQGFEGGKRPTRNICTWLKSKARKCECSPSCVRSFFTSHLPFLSIMKQYSLRQHFIPDIIAGLTVGIMHIPQGMAYGQLSTLPPVFGLYVSFFPVILYFFFGTSKHVSIGTFAVISLMVGSVVDKGMKSQGLEPASWNVTVSTGTNITYEIVDNSAELLDMKLKLAMSVTFAVGAIQLLLGVFQLGFLTVYLSDPLISGFTTGAACHVFTSQIKHIFGIPMGQYSGAFKLVFSYRDIFLNLPKTNAVTFIASIVCMLLLVVVKEYINGNPKIKPKLMMPVPAELIVVVLGTVISYFVKLEEVYNVKIVGDIPVGIPPPNLNAFTFLPNVISDAIAIAIVAFAISVSMAKIFAKKHDYDVDSNQELLAYGLCNVVSSFFSSFVSAVSLSRSLVQENVGGKTQVTGLLSSSLLLVVLLLVGPYFKTLPNCILASIILVALKGMFLQFLDLKILWGVSVIDFAVWLITFAATVLLDVDLGLLVGVGFGLLTVIIRSQRPYSCVLGQVPGTDIYRDISVYKTAEETPGIRIFRFDSALFFANAEFFKSSLYKLTVDPNHLKKKQRRMNKQKKKDDKALLKMNVDPMGSTSFSPEDIDPDLVGKHGDNNQVSNTSTPASKLDNQSVVTPSTTTGTASTAPSIIRIDMETDPNCLKELPTLTDVNFIILDCSTMSYVDSMGVKVLQQVITEFKAYNITVYLAQCKSSVREMFECTNFYKTGNKQFQFVTIHDAVVSAQLQQWALLGDSMESSRPFSNINNNMESGGGTGVADKTTETSATTTTPDNTEESKHTQTQHPDEDHRNNVGNHVDATSNERSKM